MKLIDDLRRDNLALLRDEFGGLRSLAKRLQRTDSQVSQWIQGSKNSGTGKPRGMRSDTARLIEQLCNKHSGWLDCEHTEPAELVRSQSNADTHPEVMLRQALQQVEQCFAMISPILKDLGRATLVEWAQTKSSSNETATILGGFIHSSKFMPKAPALLETPIKVVSREN